jgi:hypothetical protein
MALHAYYAADILGSIVKFACPWCDLFFFGFQIVTLLFVIGWIRSHIGGGTIATVVMLIIGYFIFFQMWWMFGPLTILYLAVMFGVAGIIMDIAFSKGYLFGEEGRPPHEGALNNPVQGAQRGILYRNYMRGGGSGGPLGLLYGR